MLFCSSLFFSLPVAVTLGNSKDLGGVLGLAVGVYVAGLSYQLLGGWLNPLFMGLVTGLWS
jgi:phosphotransferase system  glucose/maltose/N-acetylglucosamine-specific IIC component